MPSQQPEEDARKFTTESLGWNDLQTLKVQLWGKVSGFVSDWRSRGRPSKRENDAAFFEHDLCYILRAKPLIVHLPEKDYQDMDSMATALLDALNDIVNKEVLGGARSQSSGHSNWRSDAMENYTAYCGDRYPGLSAIFSFLQAHTKEQFSLVTGPGLSLFTYPAGGHGSFVKGVTKRWRAFLDRMEAETEISQGQQLISLEAMGLSADVLDDDDQSDVLEKTASLVVDVMFKEFRQLSCANPKTHEIKLRLSELYNGPPQPVLDMFVSCCPGSTSMIWHEARCGLFSQVEIDEGREQSLCTLVAQLMKEGRKLHLHVTTGGLFDITYQMPPIRSSAVGYSGEALAQLFQQKVFSPISFSDCQPGAIGKKIVFKEKAEIALTLARCLLDFFDDAIELASYSWAPEQIYIGSPFTTCATSHDLYICLRPKPHESRPSDLLQEFMAGNPVLLSFARLLLEIETGEKIPMEIHLERKENIGNWLSLCDLVERKKNAGESVQYLEAVEGCLWLCNHLPRSKNRPTGPAAKKVLRKAIYEKIVRKLELIVQPETSNRKRRYSELKSAPIKPPKGTIDADEPRGARLAPRSRLSTMNSLGIAVCNEPGRVTGWPVHQEEGQFNNVFHKGLKTSTDRERWLISSCRNGGAAGPALSTPGSPEIVHERDGSCLAAQDPVVEETNERLATPEAMLGLFMERSSDRQHTVETVNATTSLDSCVAMPAVGGGEMRKRGQPQHRDEFEIAIMCALRIEADAVEALFDEDYDRPYGRAPGDQNTYSMGRIGAHNVVLAWMPGMGKATSAAVAARFGCSFTQIKLGLIVGVCGGSPVTPEEESILLGDVIVSTAIVQYDLGRQHGDRFVRKDTLEDNLGRSNQQIRGFLEKIQGLKSSAKIKNNTHSHLTHVLGKTGFETSAYPGRDRDTLYQSSYEHKQGQICDDSHSLPCPTVGCDSSKLVTRHHLRSGGANRPVIHFGRVASGDGVLKSAMHRDYLAETENVIGFEMEGAGVWDSFPTVIIKGVCDYADSHKNKDWQRYASATAAAYMKAFLHEWEASNADG